MYICVVLGESILLLSTTYRLDLEAVLTVIFYASYFIM